MTAVVDVISQTFNRLVSANGTSFGYDTNGNQISKTDGSGSWSYSWDYENRLKQASLAGGVSVTYSYDALGRRVQRTSSVSGATRFVYDGADVVRDIDGSGATNVDYLNGPGIDNKLRQTVSGTGSYFLTDHLGTTRAITDASGGVTFGLSYDSFGNVASGSASTRCTYTGREIDLDAGLMYYRARFYDPQVGRFISEDPIGFQGGDISFYAYVHNNPIWWTDPFGKQSRSDARWQPGEVEQMRKLADHVRSMPGPRSDCGCQSKPGSPLLLAAGIAVADGPQPGITDILAVGLLLTYAFGPSQTMDCTPPKVIPFPKPEPRPTPLFPPLPQKPGEICRLRAKDGAFCINVCKDGYEFKTLTDTGSKHGNCPPAAARQ